MVPERWRLLYACNPMVGIIEGFRWSLLGESMVLYWPGLLMSIVVSSILLTSGVWYFRRMERTFADVI
jgi:lipopolysaccharide transport system permease protein